LKFFEIFFLSFELNGLSYEPLTTFPRFLGGAVEGGSRLLSRPVLELGTHCNKDEFSGTLYNLGVDVQRLLYLLSHVSHL